MFTINGFENKILKLKRLNKKNITNLIYKTESNNKLKPVM